MNLIQSVSFVSSTTESLRIPSHVLEAAHYFKEYCYEEIHFIIICHHWTLKIGISWRFTEHFAAVFSACRVSTQLPGVCGHLVTEWNNSEHDQTLLSTCLVWTGAVTGWAGDTGGWMPGRWMWWWDGTVVASPCRRCGRQQRRQGWGGDESRHRRHRWAPQNFQILPKNSTFHVFTGNHLHIWARIWIPDHYLAVNKTIDNGSVPTRSSS